MLDEHTIRDGHLTPEAFAELGHAVSRFLRGRL